LTEEPEESGYFWPNVGGPNFVPKRILDCVIPYNYVVSLMCGEGSSCLVTPSELILLIRITYFPIRKFCLQIFLNRFCTLLNNVIRAYPLSVSLCGGGLPVLVDLVHQFLLPI